MIERERTLLLLLALASYSHSTHLNAGVAVGLPKIIKVAEHQTSPAISSLKLAQSAQSL